jgi:lipoprotein-releasing system permease protein
MKNKPSRRPVFLPRRLAARLSGSQAAASWSRPVVQIATAGVGLGIALIIVASSIVHGFQSEVRDLVVGFGSDIQILSAVPQSQQVLLDHETAQRVAALDAVQAIHPFYTMPGLLQSSETLEGVMVKGIGPDTYQDMLLRSMQSGRIPQLTMSDSVVLSSVLLNQLELELGDRVSMYLIGGPTGMRAKTLIVGGVYETGLLEYDASFVFIPRDNIQQMAGWGLEAQVRINPDQRAEALVFGSTYPAKYLWTGVDVSDERVPLSWRGKGPHDLNEVASMQSVELVVTTRDSDPYLTADTVMLQFNNAVWSAIPAGGGWRFHASGYEVFLEDGANLGAADGAIYAVLPLGWRTETVLEQAPEMFTWLGMLDLNVEIIIGLMVLISVINMTSALLIIILERRSMVGMLKALGMADSQVLRMFFWQAVHILGRGFLIGNIIGFAVVILQHETGLIRLDPKAYYVHVVPIRIDLAYIVGVELIAFAICAVSMWLPAWASMRILPAAALKLKD